MEECRSLRAVAVESGLDPDKTMPEDILLLERNKDGGLLAQDRAEAARKKARYYLKRFEDGMPL